MKDITKLVWLAVIALTADTLTAVPENFSGIYPHLAMFNNEGECGVGAVAPWAGRLWVITYGPHCPQGSSDKLYEIAPDLRETIRPESVGGTPANRLIHRESQQLNIGPYFIATNRTVRVIPPAKMPGRLTAAARHLTDPANKLYIATMEEGLYEVDVHSLAVTERIKDGGKLPAVGGGIRSQLPGYHGKGLYSGQGLLVYANNGEDSEKARHETFAASGALAGWRGSGDWTLIRRNQFTEVTGPGGLQGNEHPESDPLWSIGWDARSLILMLLDGGQWHSYRLPKASHTYDGAHGWHTEWPRIRDIGERDLLMTMHGMFWRFPRTFSTGNSRGILPRSTYLKVVGDFCRWQDRVVLGCDDTAECAFLNRRKAKGRLADAQSQSNLWFLEPGQLDHFGPAIGRGAVWLNDPVKAGAASDPFLVAGFAKRALHLVVSKPATITIEVDRAGDGKWSKLEDLRVDGYQWKALDPALDAVWMRFRSSSDLDKATVWFQLAARETRPAGPAPGLFAGVARIGEKEVTGGLIRAYGGGKRTLGFAAADARGAVGPYVLDEEMKLVNAPALGDFGEMQKDAAIPSRKGIVEMDEASVVYIDDNGDRFRLPGNPGYKESSPLGPGRFCREIATERDLFNCMGAFYELPADSSGGFRRIRPISSHHLAIKDYCSYRGLLVISGVNLRTAAVNPHILRSQDGKTGLWVGAIDDLWSLGKPVGVGGPWKNTAVRAGRASDPYLMTGYDRKTLMLESDRGATITLEIDITGMGDWQVYRRFAVTPGKPDVLEFPDAFQACWARFRSSVDARVTAQFTYE